MKSKRNKPNPKRKITASLKNQEPEEGFIHFNNFDYEFRPESYFNIEDSPLHFLLSRVTGAKRRKMILNAFENGDTIPNEILSGSLSEEMRQHLSAIHPSFMGGEYLPAINENEIEVARIELESTTADVISVRARWENGVYRYSVVDEYEEVYEVPVEQTSQPMSFKELIQFLNGVKRADENPCMGIVTLYAEFNMSCGSSYDNMVNFQRAYSDVYPEMTRYYDCYMPVYLKQVETRLESENDSNN